ncbi:MAG: hypothetical protein ACKV2Q_31855 [Planctomycetaceae bacterium]
MKTSSRSFVAALALALMQAGGLLAQDDAKPDSKQPEVAEPAKSAKPTRAELRDKQLDVSLEARDIERVLSKLKKASDLAKERITEAAKTAESASTSLEKGDSKAARAEAQLTNEKFKEIVRQLEALLKEETPQRIAEARQLAQKLAQAERQFAATFQGALNPIQAGGKGKIDPRSQVKPMASPNAKGQSGQAQANGQGNGQGKGSAGKQGDKKDAEDKADAKTGEKKDPKGNDPDQPGGKGSEPRKDGTNGDGQEKPMPNGLGAGKEDDKANGNEPKPEGDGGGTKKDEKKPGDSGEGADGDDSKKKEGGGSGGDRKDKSDDKRDGTGDGGGAEMTAEERRELVANRAEQLAESGKTLQDVLNEIAKSTEPGDKEAVAKIQEVMKEIDINKIVAEMGQIADMIRETKDTDARLSSTDIAERLEIMAQRLDGAYRTIVAPQAEELRKIEAALAELREQLEKLETPSQVAAWHREVRDLLDKLDKLGVSPKDREYLEKEMVKAGFGLDVDRTKRGVNWGLVNGYYAAPVAYSHGLIHLQEDIQERIQTLILGDLGNASDEATPPKYQELVNRYYEVLSRQGGKAAPAGKPAPAKMPEMRKPKGNK